MWNKSSRIVTISTRSKYTLQTMSKYGIDNVRGGSFVRITLEKSAHDVLTNMLNGAGDRCFRCGQPGHFVADCPDNAAAANPSSSIFGYIHSFLHNVVNKAFAVPTATAPTATAPTATAPTPPAPTATAPTATAPTATAPTAAAQLPPESSSSFKIEHSKTAKATCRGCQMPIAQDVLRISSRVYSDKLGKVIDLWYHAECFFEKTWPIASLEMIDGFSLLAPQEQKAVRSLLVCSRCHRHGHTKESCYAKTTKDGRTL